MSEGGQTVVVVVVVVVQVWSRYLGGIPAFLTGRTQRSNGLRI
jgi:hypothetical protein